MAWIKPKGKTQADLDAEAAEKATEEEKRQARAYLEDTQEQMLKTIEAFIENSAAIDTDTQNLIRSRREAREKL